MRSCSDLTPMAACSVFSDFDVLKQGPAFHAVLGTNRVTTWLIASITTAGVVSAVAWTRTIKYVAAFTALVIFLALLKTTIVSPSHLRSVTALAMADVVRIGTVVIRFIAMSSASLCNTWT